MWTVLRWWKSWTSQEEEFTCDDHMDMLLRLYVVTKSDVFLYIFVNNNWVLHCFMFG